MASPVPYTPRPDRDTYFMFMAKTAALRGTCSRRYVGAVATIDRRVVATGYNGSPPGIAHCYHADDSEPCLVSEHAEWNAIVHGTDRALEGATLYCTDGACLRCAQLIVRAGIIRFVYATPFRDLAGIEWLHPRIEVVQWSVPAGWQPVWEVLGKATSSYGKRP
jgi:dCMP deaminase